MMPKKKVSISGEDVFLSIFCYARGPYISHWSNGLGIKKWNKYNENESKRMNQREWNAQKHRTTNSKRNINKRKHNKETQWENVKLEFKTQTAIDTETRRISLPDCEWWEMLIERQWYNQTSLCVVCCATEFVDPWCRLLIIAIFDNGQL